MENEFDSTGEMFLLRDKEFEQNQKDKKFDSTGEMFWDKYKNEW